MDHHLSQLLDSSELPVPILQDETQKTELQGGGSPAGCVLLLEALVPGPASILTQHSQAEGVGGGAREMHRSFAQMNQTSRGGGWTPHRQLPLGFLLQGIGMGSGQVMSLPEDLAGPEPGSCS